MIVMVGVMGRRRRVRVMGGARVFFGGYGHSEGEEDRLGAKVKDMEYVRRK